MVSDMMTGNKLMGAILQLAMQGKIVEQRPEEGTGEELYQKIRFEKDRLIRQGALKKSKKSEAISDDEKPFDIPESWKWVRVEDIAILNPKNDLDDNIDTSFIPMTLVDDAFSNHHTSESRKWGEIKKGFSHFAEGDIGVAKITPCFQNRKSVIFRDLINGYGAGTTELSIVRPFKNHCSPEYLLYIFKSELFINNGVKSFTGTAGQQRIHKDYLRQFVIPLPPLAEQKRIVAKIEELMPFVEQYAAASTKLNTLIATFPEMMKKSILQEAVQGKLVPQDPNDEPASLLLKRIAEEKKRLIKEGKIKKQKPLPEITEDEIPFDIPESWEWVRVGSYFNTSSGTTPSKSNNAYYDQKDFNWVRTTDLNNGILDKCEIQVSQKAYEECRLEIIPQDSVCIAMYGGGGTIGKNALIKFDTTINQSVCAIHPNGCNMKYIQLFMQHIRPRWMDFASGSRKDPNINQIIIKNCLVPIPPLKEQERIVENVTRLLGRIEQM